MAATTMARSGCGGGDDDDANDDNNDGDGDKVVERATSQYPSQNVGDWSGYAGAGHEQHCEW